MIEMQTKREKLTAGSKIIPPNPEDKKFTRDPKKIIQLLKARFNRKFKMINLAQAEILKKKGRVTKFMQTRFLNRTEK